MSIRKAKNELTLAAHILEKSLEREGETVENVQDTVRLVRKLLSNASTELKKRTPCYKIEPKT